jgi:hypothetical protein
MQRSLTATLALVLLAATLFTTGCQSYTTPGNPADMQVFGITSADQREKLTDYKIKQELERKPLATFPANICLARVQGNDYRNYYHHGYGQGAYSVVTTRDVEIDEHLAKIADLPMIAGLATVNRMILPSDLKSDMELRQAAAKLHAQILLLYTFDTKYYDENNASPADVITFGFGNHKKIRITVTASAALLDVRNGYVYGIAEATAQREQSTSSWNNQEKADESRRQAEAEAFDQLVTELARTWKGVVETYATPASATITVTP